MNCHRCGDTMTLKKFYDYGGYSWGWKCTRCGEIMDHIVMQNYRMKEVAQAGYLLYHFEHSMETNLQKKEVANVMDKDFSSLNFQIETKAADEPKKCGMMFCSNCSGSGRYFYADKGVSRCSFCGGFGLIKIERNFANEDDREGIFSCS
jgi:hypothetical protein